MFPLVTATGLTTLSRTDTNHVRNSTVIPALENANWTSSHHEQWRTDKPPPRASPLSTLSASPVKFTSSAVSGRENEDLVPIIFCGINFDMNKRHLLKMDL